VASCFIDKHSPWPEQSLGQDIRWQASPLKPAGQTQRPVVVVVVVVVVVGEEEEEKGSK